MKLENSGTENKNSGRIGIGNYIIGGLIILYGLLGIDYSLREAHKTIENDIVQLELENQRIERLKQNQREFYEAELEEYLRLRGELEGIRI
jgi:hypothetical protein